ncbi:MAG: uroporphyrinogen decarboxylase family protein [Armatimonadota bacterium]
MTSRELVYATLDFQRPERLPRDIWLLPAAVKGREDAVNALLAKYPTDFAGAACQNPYLSISSYTPGTYVDAWGSEWQMLQEGIIGEVKRSPLEDYNQLASYSWPTAAADAGWENTAASIAAQHDKFMLGYCGDPFERMQFLRGTENLYMDLAEDCDEVYELRDQVFAFYRQIVERWVRLDIDAANFSDDWGSQRGLLISPTKWREFFKPKYKELFDIALDAGKRIFFHSDGYIADIYPDLIELGVSALNSQVWCMGLDTLQPYVGKITFWGELDRQHTVPQGTPEDIKHAQRQMVETLYRDGGLIGQCEADNLASLDNIEAALGGWDEAFKQL